MLFFPLKLSQIERRDTCHTTLGAPSATPSSAALDGLCAHVPPRTAPSTRPLGGRATLSAMEALTPPRSSVGCCCTVDRRRPAERAQFVDVDAAKGRSRAVSKTGANERRTRWTRTQREAEGRMLANGKRPRGLPVHAHPYEQHLRPSVCMTTKGSTPCSPGAAFSTRAGSGARLADPCDAGARGSARATGGHLSPLHGGRGRREC